MRRGSEAGQGREHKQRPMGAREPHALLESQPVFPEPVAQAQTSGGLEPARGRLLVAGWSRHLIFICIQELFRILRWGLP